MKCDVQLNQYYQVTGLSVHDSELKSFCYNQMEAKILIKTLDAQELGISFFKIGELGVNALRSGAIISEVYVWKMLGEDSVTNDIPANIWTMLFCNEFTEHDVGFVSNKIISSGEYAYLVSVECSYGGGIVLICNEISYSCLPRL